MDKTVERIEGDTVGVTYELPVLRFRGSRRGPSAYLQAALHGDEFPGVVALDALVPMLQRAESRGLVRGDITIVPWANPIGRGQYLYGDLQGRFHLGTRTNFNREFPLLERPDLSLLPPAEETSGADVRLKRLLLSLSLGHDIVLDLHCDDEGVPYLYVPSALWPAMEDCAAAMGVDAVILWEGESGSAFEEASIHPYLQMPAEEARLAKRVVTTVEYRGTSDVHPSLATSDAQGLYRLLAARGVIEDAPAAPGPFRGVVAPLANIDMVSTPKAGVLLFDVAPGDRVAAGQRLARVVHAPGEEGGSVDILAPQSGYVLTRRSARALRAGDDVLKLVGDARSADARSGVLED